MYYGLLGNPGLVTADQELNKPWNVEPAPSRGAPTAQVAASMVEVQAINVCPDSHRGSV